jgi:2-C-methyl-D-erythritol 4-phosphate cytidylyltransferase
VPESVAAILLAAGSSSRMEGVDKLWVDLGGEPLVARSLHVLANLDVVTTLVAVAPAGRHAALHDLGARAGIEVLCAEGGPRRQDSVAAGLRAAPDADYYLVHDAARPLVTAEVCARVLAAAREHGAAIPVLAVADTIKRVDANDVVTETLDRALLRTVQTPQAFAGALLRRAHAEVQHDVTDDASMVEAIGAKVATVRGDPSTFKVTAPGDLEIARALLASRGER